MMMRLLFVASCHQAMRPLALAAGAVLGLAAATPAVADIKADGSSTVYPITREASRRAGADVEVKFSGTTAGFRRFCAGEIDISNASRPILKSEIDACATAGIEFIELPMAFDAMAIIVHPANDWAKSITVEQLRKLWEPAAEGKVMSWQQLHPDWPDRPIKLFGRGRNSGTYDYFTSVIVGEAGKIRTDYTASENEDELARGIASDPDALGFFGVGAYFRHWEALRDLAIDSGRGPVHPALREVLAGRYQPLGRPLFLYVNSDALEKKPELRRFLMTYLGSMQKWIHFTGYMPLSAQAYEAAIKRIEAKTKGTRFDGKLQVGVGIDDLYR